MLIAFIRFTGDDGDDGGTESINRGTERAQLPCSLCVCTSVHESPGFFRARVLFSDSSSSLCRLQISVFRFSCLSFSFSFSVDCSVAVDHHRPLSLSLNLKFSFLFPPSTSLYSGHLVVDLSLAQKLIGNRSSGGDADAGHGNRDCN